LTELAILEAEQDNFEKMSLKSFQFNLSNLAGWLTFFLVIWLLGSVGLGWLVNSFFILLGLLILAPVLAFIGFRWWLQRNLIQAQCPVCQYEFTGLNRTQLQCPSCGELLKVEQGKFSRLTPPGTIDVQAVEVPAQSLED
jgi:Na+/melibiose symporter-like transporter